MDANVKRQTLIIITMTWILGAMSLECDFRCAIYCPRGEVLDSRGCSTCRCNPAPIPDPAPFGTTVGAVCPLCLNYCYYGRETLSNGCPSCRCKSGGTSSTTTAKTPVCPQLLCRSYCFSGRVRDSNGCVTCRCQTDIPTKPACVLSLPCYFSCNYEYQKPSSCDCDCYKLPQSSSSW